MQINARKFVSCDVVFGRLFVISCFVSFFFPIQWAFICQPFEILFENVTNLQRFVFREALCHAARDVNCDMEHSAEWEGAVHALLFHFVLLYLS